MQQNSNFTGCVFVSNRCSKIIIIKSVFECKTEDRLNLLVCSANEQLKNMAIHVGMNCNQFINVYIAAKSLKQKQIPQRISQKLFLITNFEEQFGKLLCELTTYEGNGPNYIKKLLTSKLYKNFVRDFVYCFTEMDNEVTKKRPYEVQFPLNFHDPQTVVEFNAEKFPESADKLFIVPAFNRLPDNILQDTSENTGELLGLAKTGSFMGEVACMQDSLLPQLQHQFGILLKSFSQEKLQALLAPKSFKPKSFQLDWLYINRSLFTVFEIGLWGRKNNDFFSPDFTIFNKIEQCLEKIIPSLSIFAYSACSLFCKIYNQDIETVFLDFWDTYVQVVIYFPNIRAQDFYKTIHAALHVTQKNQREPKQTENKPVYKLGQLLLQNKNSLQKIRFLMPTNQTLNVKDQLQFFQLNYEQFGQLDFEHYLPDNSNNYSILLQQLNFNAIFHKELPIVSETSYDFLQYFSSLCCVGQLKVLNEFPDIPEQPIGIDERYKSTTKILNEKTAEIWHYTLSPQQKKILTDTGNTHLVLRGFPGTGKTCMLLEKAVRMCASSQVKRVIFLLSQNKRPFIKWLQTEIQGWRADQAEKMEIKDFDADLK